MNTTHTWRYELVTCPACEGQGGQEETGYTTIYGAWEPIRDERWTEWTDCPVCEGSGEVQRVDRLAHPIGKAREEEARLAPLVAPTMPVIRRTGVMA